MKTTAKDCKNSNLQSDWKFQKSSALLFTFWFFFYALIPTLTLLVILMAIGNTRHISRRIISPFPIYLVRIFVSTTIRSTIFYVLRKKWVPTYTTVVAYLTTIAQPFPIFRKLLAIIPSMKNHPHLIILNQKINTNTKSPMLLTQLVL